MYWNAQRHNWQLQENQTGISTDNCLNVRIKSSAWNDHHPPSHKLKNYSMWSICNRRCTKHAWLISTTSNITSELSEPSWITPTLLQLCIIGVDVFQLVWSWMVVISSTAFNSNIWTVVGWYFSLIFLQLSVMTLCVLIHDDCLIHKVK